MSGKKAIKCFVWEKRKIFILFLILSFALSSLFDIYFFCASVFCDTNFQGRSFGWLLSCRWEIDIFLGFSNGRRFYLRFLDRKLGDFEGFQEIPRNSSFLKAPRKAPKLFIIVSLRRHCFNFDTRGCL
jgi:hypothetical protein